MNQIRIKYFAFLLGTIAMVVQILLLRSFLAVFYGTELAVGLLLAFWLLWTAAGSWFGNRIIRRAGEQLWRWTVLALYFALFWTTVILIANKWIRWLLAVPSGEFISMHQFLLFAAPMLAPVCFSLGFCFTCLAQLFYVSVKTHGSPSSIIYIFEAIGSATGSVLFTFIFVRVLSPLQIICLLWFCVGGLTAWFDAGKRKSAISMAVIAIIVAPFTPALEKKLASVYWASQFKEVRLLETKTSRYGELALIEWGGEKSLYANSLKQTTLPDLITAQAQAALVMHQHPRPEKILLIEGGLNGLAPELAGYPGTQVDYVEMDGEANVLAMRHLSTELRQSWKKNNLHIYHEDGRRYLSRTKTKYDLILINVGRPISAFSNRYYTEEFFASVVEKLQPNGLFGILGFPSAENYLGQELLQLNAAIYHGLKKYFSEVLVIPGDEAFYLAALKKGSLSDDPAVLMQRMENRGTIRNYFFPQMFAQYLPVERLQFITEQLQSFQHPKANLDFQPIVYYVDLMLWHKMTQGATRFLHFLSQIDFRRLFMGYLLLLLLLSFVLLLQKKHRSCRVMIWNGACLGFTGITLNILFLLALQNIFGYVFEGMGLAMAAFMLGMGLASAFSRSYLQRQHLTVLKLILLINILFCIALPYALQNLQKIYSLILFFVAIFFCGSISGAGFPLLFHQYDQMIKSPRWGSIYAADLAGSAVGSLLVSAIAVPLWGFAKTCLLPAMACAMGLFLSMTINNHTHQ